jgi:ABC-2 type transport system ATP-binding protein
MNEIVISAEGLAKTYGRGAKKVEAVRGIDLQVCKGEIFGLVGPDGAGKTTTIQMLCGILTPTAGSANVAGVDIFRNADALGGAIGYMSEGFSLYGSLSVDENIDFFAQLYKVPPELASERKEKLLNFARLVEARSRRAERLSGGMKKKLALACTLIYQPQVLFLDGPTTGVDPASRQDFWKILYEFLAEGITIFVSTPYMDEAERCHKVALMRQGKIIASDSPAILKAMPQGVSLEMIANPQMQALSVLRREPAVRQVQVFGDRLHVLLSDGQGVVASLPDQLRAAGIEVTGYQTTTPSLEDVFISAIQENDGSGETGRTAPLQQSYNIDVFTSGTPNSNGIAVQVDDLTRRFGEFTAVDCLNFNVQRGEIFGFLGPNGSGKTTTIRMLTGLLPPSAGRASVAGFKVSTERVAMKAHIGYMSQKFSLYNDLTVGENIHFFGDVYGLPPKRLAERQKWVLEMAGLSGKKNILASQLSGGWKQRLALGCAILHEPEILFLDEPTSGVDPVSRRQFWDLIFELSTQGITVFVTTHYMDEAEHCHNLGLLYRGRLIARGSPAELRANMKLGALLEIPVSDSLAALSSLQGMPEIIQTNVLGDRLHVLVWDAEANQLSIEQKLASQSLLAGKVQAVPVSLEDLFMLFIDMEEAGRKARQTDG